MRHLILVSLLALLALLETSSTAAQSIIESQGVDDAELHEIKSGAQWSVFEQVDSSAGASLGDPSNNTFAVFPALAVDELEVQGILSAAEAQDIRDDLAAEGLDYREVADLFVVHLEAAAEAAEKSANFSHYDLEMAPKGCFGWQSPRTVSGNWDWSHPGNFDLIHIEGESFTGELTATVPLSAEISGSATYRIKKVACIPVKIRLIEALVTGEVTISNGNIAVSAELDYTTEWNWERNLYTVDLGRFRVGPLRLDFKLPVDFGIETSVAAAGKAELRADLDATASFHVTCTSSECDGPTSFDYDFDVADPVYEFTLDANAKIWARAAVIVELFDDRLAFASVGATGFVQTHLFGYLGNRCGDLDGDGSGDTIEDLLLDLDVGYEVDARLGGAFLPDEEWTLLDGQRHVKFWDLWQDGEGWNVLDPLVTGPEKVDAGQVVTYELETRPCYPFSDDLTLEWTGPVTGTGSLTPKTGSLSDSEVPVAGDHTLVVTMVSDAHGRDLGVSTSKPVTVTYPDFDTPHANDRFARALAGGDFDCDGYDDLAIGVPWEDSGSASDTGLVTVLLAHPAGSGLPSMAAGRVLHLFNHPVAANATTGARFGYELTVGDFNGDGCDDLAVGAPRDRENQGVAQIVYGSGDPLALLVERDHIFLGNASFPGDGVDGDRLGEHMAAGDLDGDGYDDLAITLPGRNKSSGAVLVAYGSPAGTYDSGKEALIDQKTPGVPGVAEAGDGSDMDVAVGDFDGDGYDDLAIGFPRQDYEARGDGFAVVLYGTSNGLATLGNDGFGQRDLANGGGKTRSENGDHFGWALATGDFDGDGYDDLAIGSSGEGWGRTARAGITQVVKGSATGLSWESGVQVLHQRKFGLETEDPSYFGSALEVADFNGDGYDDLAIGGHAKSQFFDAPGPGLVSFAGEAYVAYGQADGTLDIPGRSGSTEGYVFSRATPGFEGPQSPGMQTGYSLAAGDFDSDGSADLAIGSFGSQVDGQTETGSCNVLYGHPARLSIVDALYLEQNSSAGDVPDGDGGDCGNSDSETDLSGGQGAELRYTFDVDACASTFTIALSGGTGDPDLYVGFGSKPTTAAYDCGSLNIDTGETCTFTPPQAGRYHILVYGYSAFSGVTLSASYE